nr:hypothetical protein [Parafrankia elaeagni]
MPATTGTKATAAVRSPLADLNRRHHPGRHSVATDVLLTATRVSLGWIFLWAFLDNLFGLGHETPSAQAWVNGGSPTDGLGGWWERTALTRGRPYLI